MNGDVNRILRQTAAGVFAIGLTAAAAALTAPVTAQTVEVQELVPSTSALERDFATGQAHPYTVQLAAGDFIYAVASPLGGMDMALALVGPDGTDLVSVDINNAGISEILLAVASSAGRHQLKVTSAKASPAGARYAIRVDATRPATSADVVRVGATRRLEEGVRLARPRQAGSQARAIGLFAQALAEFRQTADRRGEARALLESAWIQYDLLSADAIDTARQAVAIYRDLADTFGLSDALTAFSLVSLRHGDPGAARDALTENVAMAQEMKAPALEARARNALGMVYGRTGDAERAADEFQRALTLARGSRSPEMTQGILNNLGIAAKDLGDYRLSLDSYTEALALSRASGDRTIEANALNNVGNLYRILGDYQKARQSHDSALAIAREIGNRDHEARALNTLGLTFYRLGDFPKALDHHEQSLAIRRRLDDPAGQASTLDGAARAWHRLGNSDKAVAYLTEALRLRRSVAERYAEADSLLHLAQVERDRGNLPEALDHVEASVQLTDSLRGRVVSSELRASFVAAEAERYEVYIDTLMQLDAVRPGTGFAARALEASERGRARVLLESLIEARTDIRQGIDPALLASERTYQRQLDEASTRVSQLIARKSDGKELDAARGGVEKLNVEYQRLEARIRQESPGYAALTQPRALTTGEIQRELLDDDTILLEFRLGEKRSWLWAVTSTALNTYELPPRQEIETAARQIYRLLTARQPNAGESPAQRTRRIAEADTQWRTRSMAVSQMLLGQAARQMGDGWRRKRLLIAAADVLEYLPFSALPDPAGRRQPLVEGHEIVNVPSASVLALIRQQTDGRAPAARRLAILADPVFEVDDPRVTTGGSATSRPRSEQREKGAQTTPSALLGRAVRSAAFVGETRAPRLSRLPFSRQEALAVAAFVPAGERLEATGFEANRAIATDGGLGGYRYVHFATHGFLNSEHPGLSGLVLSLVRPDGTAQDGFLRLNDIYNLRLPADLVVLSACQTALGKDIRGEGLVGLTRGFMYAGARRVVASLWQVDDLATAELMRAFYRGMLKDGLPPAAALRAAQRRLSAQPQWSSPFFWSAFVLQGEWK